MTRETILLCMLLTFLFGTTIFYAVVSIASSNDGNLIRPLWHCLNLLSGQIFLEYTLVLLIESFHATARVPCHFSSRCLITRLSKAFNVCTIDHPPLVYDKYFQSRARDAA